MPYSYPNNVPRVALHWTDEEKKKCTAAANAVLQDGGSEQDAIFACIHNAGKGKKKGTETMKSKLYKVNGEVVSLKDMAVAWLEKEDREALRAAQQARSKKYGIAVLQEGSNLTMPKSLESLGATEGDLADPVNYKYPVWLTNSVEEVTGNPTKLGMVRNALVRFEQFGDAYSGGGAAKVRARIEQARKKFKIGEYSQPDAAKKDDDVEKNIVDFEVPILKQVEEKQIVYGAVLIPGKADLQGDTMNEEDVEAAAHKFMIKSRLIDLQHQETLEQSQARPVESYLLPEAMKLGSQDLPKGTWILAAHIPDKTIWNSVKKGELNAFSIKGVGKRKPV